MSNLWRENEDMSHRYKRGIHLSILALILFSVHSFAADHVEKPTTPTARMVFQETEFDFGFFKPGEPAVLEHKFAFENAGDAKLRVWSVGKACRTTAFAPRATVAPGESSFISVRAALPAGYTDSKHFSRTIKVRSNDTEHPETELAIKAKFSYTLEWNPEQVNLGTVRSGVPTTTAIVVSSLDGQPFTVLSCRSLSGWLATASPVPSAAQTPGEGDNTDPRVEILLRLRSDAPPGEVVDTLEILTDRKDIPVIEIPVFGRVAARLRLDPTEVFFGVVDRSEPSRREVSVLCDPNRVRLGRPSTGCRHLKAKTHKTADGYCLELILNTKKAPELVDGEVSIRTNLPDQPRIRIPFRALVKR